MSRFKNRVDAQQAHILSLKILSGGLFVLCLALLFGWFHAPKHLTVHVPPDLRSGSTRLWWDIPPENVYAFAFYVFQQLHRWPVDGEQDYRNNIHALQHFFTPACQTQLQQDFRSRQGSGELRGRVRGIYEILGRGYADNPALRVQSIGQNAWRVNLDLNADEYYLTEAVKRTAVRYPLLVLRHDVDTQNNPWGLVIDCFDGTPQRLEVAGAEERS